MFNNHLKIAWRSLTKNKGFTFLNMIGLSIAFAIAILLNMAALFELSYDDFHENADRIYKVYQETQVPGGVATSDVHAMPFSPALKKDVPGVERSTRYMDDFGLLQNGDKEFGIDMNWVDQDFFTMFTLPVYKSSSKQILPKGAYIVITKETANKIFGTLDVIGNDITLVFGKQPTVFTISAILEDLPPNSSFDFDIIGNFESSPRYKWLKDEWNHSNHNVYVQLEAQTSLAAFQNRTLAFIKQRFDQQIKDAKRDGALPNENNTYVQLNLVPLADAYFANFRNGNLEINKSLPYILMGLAGLLLCIACVNFINISVAKSTNRLQEIGVRKTLGAAKKHVFVQFWLEGILLFLITLTIGLVLSIYLESLFQNLFNTEASLSNTISYELLLIGFSLFLVITLIAGGYPALLVSKLGTLQALKNTVSIKGKNKISTLLIVVQFSIVILLISGSFVLLKQLNYMQEKDLGFNKEQIISLPLNTKKDSYQVLDLLRNKLLNHPDILGITGADINLGRGKDGNQSTSRLGFDYKNRQVGTNMLIVDHDYINTLGLTLMDGRPFDSNYKTDSLSVLINEAMAEELQEENPIGKQIPVVFEDKKHTIIGVVKDYHFRKLDREIAPLTFFKTQNKPLKYAYIKVAANSHSRVLDRLQIVWNQIEPNADFLASFLDENIERTFKKEKNIIAIITSGAVLAIILSCIGLLAMTLLIVNQKTKEIGVRKVIGASALSLLLLFSKNFIKLVGIAFILITPIAWWYSDQWLTNYAYHVEINSWIFLSAGVLALVIVLVTISFGTLKAALQNPVKSLRTE